MRARFWAIVLLLALATTRSLSARAQESGTLQGRVINGTTGGRPVPGLEVTLNIYKADSSEGASAAQTDAEGSFRFTGLSTTEGNVYQVAVDYQRATYRSEALSFAAGQDTLTTEITVYEATESDVALSIERAHLVIEFATDGIAVTEMLVVRNDGDGTYVGLGPEVAPGKTATLRFPLPPGAELMKVGESLMQCCVMPTEEGFVDTMPVLPGVRTVLYVYTLPYRGRTLDLRRAFAYPAGGLDIFLADGVAEVDVPGFSQVGMMETSAGPYARWKGGGLAAGEPVVIRLQDVPLGEGEGSGRAVAIREAAGWVLVAAAILLALAYSLWRRWQAPPEMVEAAVDVGEARETLLQRLADLDDALEAGEVAEAEYQMERAVLKRRLLALWDQAPDSSTRGKGGQMGKRGRGSKRARRRRASRKSRGALQRYGPWAIAILLIISSLGGLLYLAGQRGPSTSSESSSGQLPTAGPIHAIHEIDPYQAPLTGSLAQGPPPDIEVSTTYSDFGSVHPSEEVIQEFTVRNLGQGDLAVTSFYTTCGCTTADLSAGIIPPGGQATLTIYFDPDFHEVVGEVERGVVIESNDPDEPVVEIWLHGVVLER